MFALLLVPLLPLLAALIVVIGSARSRHARARLAAWPIGAAFCAAIATLYVVATQGSVTIRFYDPASLVSIAFPIGATLDQLLLPSEAETMLSDAFNQFHLFE
jgi:NADH-quinone oxidoreductase subunit L